MDTPEEPEPHPDIAAPPLPPHSEETNPLLSRRERQIMDAIYARGESTAAEVRAALNDAPSYSTVRALLRILEDKGHLRHSEQGTRYVYAPTRARQMAAQSALRQVVQTFFGGSALQTVATLLSTHETRLSSADIARLSALIEAAGDEDAPGSTATDTVTKEASDGN